MSYDFNTVYDRTQTDSIKWQKYSGKDIIPLWIADTDFRSPPAVINALQQRVQHGIFGYGKPSNELIDIFIQRMYAFYQWKINAEWLIFLPGVICGLHLAVRALTEEKQGVISPHPIYPPFIQAIKVAKRQQILAPLRLKQERWLMDLSSAEKNCTGNEKLMLLCNPQNPGGTVYRQDELEEQLAFAQKHHLYVCSDEIHCDLILKKGIQHIPFASLSNDAAKRSITLMAPSKSFNIAGLGIAIAIIPNPQLRAQFLKAGIGRVSAVNTLAYVAATAAYRDGKTWLEDQIAYLRNNHILLHKRINLMPGLKMYPSEGSFLAWIDVSALPIDNPHAFFEQAGVGLSAGNSFGDDKFVRLNFACPRTVLENALDRMECAIATLGY